MSFRESPEYEPKYEHFVSVEAHGRHVDRTNFPNDVQRRFVVAAGKRPEMERGNTLDAISGMTALACTYFWSTLPSSFSKNGSKKGEAGIACGGQQQPMKL